MRHKNKTTYLLQTILILFFLFVANISQAQLARDFDRQLLSTTQPTIKVGIAPGSFDPPTIAHINLIIESIKILKLDKFVVAVNVKTAKDFNASVSERIALVKNAFGPYADKVIVVPRPFDDLNQLARVIRKSFRGEMYAVLGEDVFKKNHELLQNIPHLKFAMIPRPEEMTTRINLSEYANTQLLDISFPGISSSTARNNITSGASIENLLLPEVASSIEANNLYHIFSDELKQIRQSYMLELAHKISKKIETNFHYQMPEPEALAIKNLQSPEGYIEKIIRLIVEKNNLNPKKSSELRKVILDFYETEKSNHRVGYIRGSFDPINVGQINMIKKSMQDLKLHTLVVGVINSQATQTVESALVRQELVKEAFKEMPQVKVVIESKGPQEIVDFISSTLAAKSFVILGENIFAKNWDLLKEKSEKILFTLIRRPGNDIATLMNSDYVIDAPVGAEIDSKDHAAVFQNSDITIVHSVSKMIAAKGYYKVFRALKCEDLF